MKFKIIAIGKCKDSNLLKLIEDYAKRLQNKLEIVELKASNSEAESESIFAKIGNYHPILLDENGQKLSSVQFAQSLQKNATNGHGKIAFCIGGADGHSDLLKQQIKDKISLSDMTLPHMLVRLVLTEQLYRAESIISGHPYHRA